jgi:adenylosuccinate lyase
VGAHVVDSVVYGHLWGTSEVRELLSDRGRTQSWLHILAVLAECQAELGLVPAAAAQTIAQKASVDLLNLDDVAARTRATSHSTLGLIQVWREILGSDAGEWVYYGATVQDLTDTWTALVMKRVTGTVFGDLRAIEKSLLDLAATHRDTVMVGRTHGQPGLPITFGFKAAVWASELRRHIDRLIESRGRLFVGQLGGAVGTCSFWGNDGLELQRRFCERLGLEAPDMTWLTARDRVAEFLTLMAMVSGTVAKMGREVYNLQRPEIGEVTEASQPGSVGSITMPHKRNPELSEQLGTLARVVRSAAALALEGMVHEHERDGTAWKAEWAFLPEGCMAAAASASFGRQLAAGLEIKADRMSQNVHDQEGYVMSEPVLRALSPRVGKHVAHEIVYEAAMAGLDGKMAFRDALAADSRISRDLSREEFEELLDPARALGLAGELVDRVVDAGERARSSDPPSL